MTGPQVTAALGLIRKTLPGLTATELTAEVECKNEAALPQPDTFEEWLKYVELTRGYKNERVE